MVRPNNWITTCHNQFLIRQFDCFYGLLACNEWFHYDIFLKVNNSDHFVPAGCVHKLIGKVNFCCIYWVSKLKDIHTTAALSFPLPNGAVICTAVNESTGLIKTVDPICMTYHWESKFFCTYVPAADQPIFITQENQGVTEIVTRNERMLFFRWKPGQRIVGVLSFNPNISFCRLAIWK